MLYLHCRWTCRNPGVVSSTAGWLKEKGRRVDGQLDGSLGCCGGRGFPGCWIVASGPGAGMATPAVAAHTLPPTEIRRQASLGPALSSAETGLAFTVEQIQLQLLDKILAERTPNLLPSQSLDLSLGNWRQRKNQVSLYQPYLANLTSQLNRSLHFSVLVRLTSLNASLGPSKFNSYAQLLCIMQKLDSEEGW